MISRKKENKRRKERRKDEKEDNKVGKNDDEMEEIEQRGRKRKK